MIPRTCHFVFRGRSGRSRRLVAAVAASAVGAVLCLFAPSAEASPQSNLTPLLTCIDVNGDGSITAHFGYTNVWTNTVTVPAGKVPPGQQNWFLPDPKDRGQPSKFQVGTLNDVFTVTFSTPTLEWRLGDVNGAFNLVIVDASGTRCTPVPAVGFDSPWPVAVVAVGLGAALAVRRRSSRGRDSRSPA